MAKARQYTDPIEAVEGILREIRISMNSLCQRLSLEEDGKPVGLVESDDAVIFFNFRPDRAIQLSKYSRMRISAASTVVRKHPKNLYFVCLTMFSETVDGFVAYQAEESRQHAW